MILNVKYRIFSVTYLYLIKRLPFQECYLQLDSNQHGDTMRDYDSYLADINSMLERLKEK
jgi:hypothetical protein